MDSIELPVNISHLTICCCLFVVEPFICIYECSCYSWSVTLPTTIVHDAWRVCFNNSGGFTIGLQTIEEEEFVAKLFGSYFQWPVWTSGRMYVLELYIM